MRCRSSWRKAISALSDYLDTKVATTQKLLDGLEAEWNAVRAKEVFGEDDPRYRAAYWGREVAKAKLAELKAARRLFEGETPNVHLTVTL